MTQNDTSNSKMKEQIKKQRNREGERHSVKMARAALFVVAYLILAWATRAESRSISEAVSDLISDGIHAVHQPHLLNLGRLSASVDACEQTYGFLPCTTNAFGNLFLMAVYGWLMYLAAKTLSMGSELLLDTVGPGIIGGLFLPILGALPDALLILVSGLSGSKETAQNQVSIGIGLLAGSTIMLLTVLWGSCVLVGKTDLSENSTPLASQASKQSSFSGTGVTTDLLTSYAARIMVISLIPFVIVQLPTVFKSSGNRIAILVSLIVSIAFLLCYCLYQVLQPWIQKRRQEYARLKLVVSGIIKEVQKNALGRLLSPDGNPNIPVMEKVFQRIDVNSDGYISLSELSALIMGINFEGIDLDSDDATEMVMHDFDISGDERISPEEFVKGLSKWLYVAKRSVRNPIPYSRKFVYDFHKMMKEEHESLIDDKNDKDGPEEKGNGHEIKGDPPSTIWFKAGFFLLLGTVIAAVFADPLVDAVDNFSSATSIPSFFISFIAMPFATNSSEAVSAIIFASRKNQLTTSLTFSEIYGAVTMNNTLCLAVFLALVYARHLTWDFSAEVLIIFIVSIVMGLFASFRTRFSLWTSIVAFLLYPLSLVLVYVLDYCLGWT